MVAVSADARIPVPNRFVPIRVKVPDMQCIPQI